MVAMQNSIIKTNIKKLTVVLFSYDSVNSVIFERRKRKLNEFMELHHSQCRNSLCTDRVDRRVCFGTFLFLLFNFLTTFWLRTTDEGSVPEMSIWSISLI